MPRRAFSDTAFFYALADSADRWHPNCELVFQQLEEQGWALVTTLFVVAETHALLVQRISRSVALTVVRNIMDSVGIVPIEPADLDKAFSILERYSDKDFSLTDAISFAVMERLGISVALSVDRHFVEYGGGFFVAPLMGTRVPE
jgi:predicted nucleic acid-binding protein